MKFKLLSVAVALVALWVAPSAFASGSGGPGGAQIGAQNAATNQGAFGVAASDQNAVNANVPVSIAGGNIYSDTSSATQTPTSTATTDVSNHAKTDQNQRLNQNIDGGATCKAGCGGAGGFQAGVQNAQTNQLAAGAAVEQAERSERKRPGLDRGRQHHLRPELRHADGELVGQHRRLEQR